MLELNSLTIQVVADPVETHPSPHVIITEFGRSGPARSTQTSQRVQKKRPLVLHNFFPHVAI